MTPSNDKMTTPSAHPTPGTPAIECTVPDSLKNVWVLFYLTRGNPNPIFRFFKCTGKLQDAVTRGRRYCDIMGYRWLFVTPASVDMDKEERAHNNILDPSE